VRFDSKHRGALDRRQAEGKRQDASSTLGVNVDAAACRVPEVRIWAEPARQRSNARSSRAGLASCLALALLAGCMHVRPPIQPGAPVTYKSRDILAVLARSDAAASSFRAAAGFTLRAPDLEASKQFTTGTIIFRKPDGLVMIGRHRTGATVFRLTSHAKEFLVEFPTEREYIYRAEGETLDGVAGAFSPADIAREAFASQDWQTLTPQQLHVLNLDLDDHTVTFEMRLPDQPVRVFTVRGPDWVVVRSELYGDDGLPVAVSARRNYVQIDGARIPTRVLTEFPQHDARITFELRNIRLNPTLDPSLFDIRRRLQEIRTWKSL